MDKNNVWFKKSDEWSATQRRWVMSERGISEVLEATLSPRRAGTTRGNEQGSRGSISFLDQEGGCVVGVLTL